MRGNKRDRLPRVQGNSCTIWVPQIISPIIIYASCISLTHVNVKTRPIAHFNWISHESFLGVIHIMSRFAAYFNMIYIYEGLRNNDTHLQDHITPRNRGFNTFDRMFEFSVGLLSNQSLVLEYFLLVFSRSSVVTRFSSILRLSTMKCERHEHGMWKHVILQRDAKFVF